jgi:hypothetical protein
VRQQSSTAAQQQTVLHVSLTEPHSTQSTLSAAGLQATINILCCLCLPSVFSVLLCDTIAAIMMLTPSHQATKTAHLRLPAGRNQHFLLSALALGH